MTQCSLATPGCWVATTIRTAHQRHTQNLQAARDARCPTMRDHTLLLVSLDGRQLVSTRQPWGTPLQRVVEPDSLQRLIASRGPVVGVVRPARDGGPEHLFAIRVPVTRQNALKYVLSAIVNVESLARVVPRHQPNSEEWTRTIIDSEGTIAVRTRGAEDYVGAPAAEAFRARIRQSSESVSRQATREGVQVYAAFSRGMYGWTAVVVVPQPGWRPRGGRRGRFRRALRETDHHRAAARTDRGRQERVIAPASNYPIHSCRVVKR